MLVAEPKMRQLADLLKAETGIVVGLDKAYLVLQRLAPVAEIHGLRDVESVISAAAGDRGRLWRDVIDALTTNESYFFRDAGAFEVLRRAVLPAVLVARQATRRLRIWSAACADGQEPYSLAMLVNELGLRQQGWTVDILATDLSTRALEKARTAIYSHFEVQRGLPARLLVRHFAKAGADAWRLSPDIAGAVEFRSHNLMTDAGQFGTFDLILCRNVLIYFDVPQKTEVLRRLTSALARDGALALGGAESIFGLPVPLETVPGAPCWHRRVLPAPANGGAA